METNSEMSGLEPLSEAVKAAHRRKMIAEQSCTKAIVTRTKSAATTPIPVAPPSPPVEVVVLASSGDGAETENVTGEAMTQFVVDRPNPVAPEPHSIALIFPMLEESEMSALAQDIAANGLKQPILLFEGKILDGRNRYNACKIAAVEPTFEKYLGDDPISHVLSLNLNRRHLTTGQRAMIAAELSNLKHGGDRKSDQDATLQLENMSRFDASKLLNVSKRSVDEAAAINKVSPDLANQIKSGSKTLARASREAKKVKKKLSLPKVQVPVDSPYFYLDRRSDDDRSKTIVGQTSEIIDELWPQIEAILNGALGRINEKVLQCNHWIAVEEIYNAFQKQMSESTILTHHEHGGHESLGQFMDKRSKVLRDRAGSQKPRVSRRRS
jgi:ParB-like chromosome segregation protein Spo0J